MLRRTTKEIQSREKVLSRTGIQVPNRSRDKMLARTGEMMLAGVLTAGAEERGWRWEILHEGPQMSSFSHCFFCSKDDRRRALLLPLKKVTS